MKFPAALVIASTSAGISHGQFRDPLPFAPPKAGTVPLYNGVAYRVGATVKGVTRASLDFGRRSATVALHLKDLFLTVFRRVGKQRATFGITQETPLRPFRIGARYRYSWRARIDGQDDGEGHGELRVFSGFDSLRAAGRNWKVVLIVKEQTWKNRKGDRFRPCQNFFCAPALGFYVEEERFLFRNGRALRPVALTLKSVSGARKR